jgi:lipoprotein-anchoring transpeptidase ErfK/SrfK
MSNHSHLYHSLTLCLGGTVLLHPIQAQAATQASVRHNQLQIATRINVDYQTANQHPLHFLPKLYQPLLEPDSKVSQSPISANTKPKFQGTSKQQTPNSSQPEQLPPESSMQQVRLVVRLRKRRVDVYKNRVLQISYPVAVGQPGWETPKGKFQVIEMQKNPGWTHPLTQKVVPPGRDNPLGERWIAFWTDGNNYIGFHGTPDRRSIGKAASHGCVRMYNEHVRELYQLVKPGTPVIVEP